MAYRLRGSRRSGPQALGGAEERYPSGSAPEAAAAAPALVTAEQQLRQKVVELSSRRHLPGRGQRVQHVIQIEHVPRAVHGLQLRHRGHARSNQPQPGPPLLEVSYPELGEGSLLGVSSGRSPANTSPMRPKGPNE